MPEFQSTYSNSLDSVGFKTRRNSKKEKSAMTLYRAVFKRELIRLEKDIENQSNTKIF